MISEQTVAHILQEMPEMQSYFIVEVKVSKNNEVVVRIDKNEGISIDECGLVSRILYEKLEQSGEDFELEVSSPGLSEPFKVVQQYVKNIGKQVEIIATDGRKIKGVLSFADSQKVEVVETIIARIDGKRQKVEEKTSFEYGNIQQAKLIITFK